MRTKLNSCATLACLAAIVAGLTLVGQTRSMAQADASSSKSEQPVTLNFEKGDIQAVLKALFNDIGANYSIDSDVSGSVSISMSNVGFLAALRSVLRANNPPLTFDYTDGVYHIRIRAQEHPAAVTVEQPSTGDTEGSESDSDNGADNSTGNMRYYRIPIDHYDVREMAGFIASMNRKVTELVPVEGSSMSGGGGSGSGSGVGVMNGGGGINNGGGSGSGGVR